LKVDLQRPVHLFQILSISNRELKACSKYFCSETPLGASQIENWKPRYTPHWSTCSKRSISNRELKASLYLRRLSLNSAFMCISNRELKGSLSLTGRLARLIPVRASQIENWKIMQHQRLMEIAYEYKQHLK